METSRTEENLQTATAGHRRVGIVLGMLIVAPVLLVGGVAAVAIADRPALRVSTASPPQIVREGEVVRRSMVDRRVEMPTHPYYGLPAYETVTRYELKVRWDGGRESWIPVGDAPWNRLAEGDRIRVRWSDHGRRGLQAETIVVLPPAGPGRALPERSADSPG